ncbi:MAG: phosphate-starvation-inducible PsiE family protein [Pseudanabaenaceae cyanobacterium]
MPPPFRRARRLLIALFRDDDNVMFLAAIEAVLRLVAKFLAVGMVLVTLVLVVDLGRTLLRDFLRPPHGGFSLETLAIFGLFLNVLIALEILENIGAYLRTHAVQLELVVATSLTAVARKIIIFDSKKSSGSFDLGGLALAIVALALSYWIVRHLNRTPPSAQDPGKGKDG